MSNIVMKLRHLLSTKKLIKQAIQDMGVENVSEIFSSYPDKIREIPQNREEVLQLDTFHRNIQNECIEVGFKNNQITVREDTILIFSVNANDIYEIAGSELDDRGDGGEVGPGTGGFTP